MDLYDPSFNLASSRKHRRIILRVIVSLCLLFGLLLRPEQQAGAVGLVTLRAAASQCYVNAAGIPTIMLGWIFDISRPGVIITRLDFRLSAPAIVATDGTSIPGGVSDETVVVPPALAISGASIIAIIHMQTANINGQPLIGYGDWSEQQLSVADSTGAVTSIPDQALAPAGFPVRIASATEVAANCIHGTPQSQLSANAQHPPAGSTLPYPTPSPVKTPGSQRTGVPTPIATAAAQGGSGQGGSSGGKLGSVAGGGSFIVSPQHGQIPTPPAPTGPVTFARPLMQDGEPIQATIAGGRKMPCPSVTTLLAIMDANVRNHAPSRLAPPYPAGCLWLPIHVARPTSSGQFAGALVVVTARFPDQSTLMITNNLDKRGSAIDVIPVPYLPPLGATHGSSATIASLTGVVIDKSGLPTPPFSDRFVVARTLSDNGPQTGTAPQPVTFARPLMQDGEPIQATIAGGRKMPCPSVTTLLAIIDANVRNHAPSRLAPPYPAGCLWLPIRVTNSALAGQYAGAVVVVTARFPDGSVLTLTNNLSQHGSAIDVLPVSYMPPIGSVHGSPATIATITGVIIDKNGLPVSTFTDHFVIS